MITTPIQFELLWESAPACAASRGAVLPIAVPQEPQFLVVSPETAPRFCSVADDAASAAVLLQPVLRGPLQGPTIVMLSMGDARTRVNGLPAPAVAVLHERDCVQLGDDAVFHVALRVFPNIVASDSLPHEGLACPICATPFKARQQVYLCPYCDAPMHAGGEGGLDCVNHTSECRRCHRDVIRRETLTAFPALVAHAPAR